MASRTIDIFIIQWHASIIRLAANPQSSLRGRTSFNNSAFSQSGDYAIAYPSEVFTFDRNEKGAQEEEVSDFQRSTALSRRRRVAVN